MLDMDNASKHAAKLEGNLCFLGEFATDIDYALDDAGELAFVYGVSLSEVGKELKAWAEQRCPVVKDLAGYFET